MYPTVLGGLFLAGVFGGPTGLSCEPRFLGVGGAVPHSALAGLPGGPAACAACLGVRKCASDFCLSSFFFGALLSNGDRLLLNAVVFFREVFFREGFAGGFTGLLAILFCASEQGPLKARDQAHKQFWKNLRMPEQRILSRNSFFSCPWDDR